MSLRYLLHRLFFFFLVIWAGTTLIFFLPKLAPHRDPIQERMGMMIASGGAMAEDVEAMAKAYEKKFGLDKPLWEQYVAYLNNMIRLDLGYSLALYPSRVITLILQALPWTIGLLATSTLVAFTLGTMLGGLLAWPQTPRIVHWLLPPLFTLSAIPYYLLSLLLLYLLAFKLRLLPLGGGSQYGTLPTFTWHYVLDVLRHALLPAASIVLAGMGFWAISMRGMMVMTEGEDYVTFAKAKGLPSHRIFLWYVMRNSLLPQTTALALSLGTVLSGSLLVEIVFRYPGIGSLLFKSITGFDYFVIYGVVFFIIITIAVATLILDLIYPLLDPRVTYQRP